MHILITGASSGLGTALALTYAAPGNTLYLGGRNLPRLQRVVEECVKQGATARLNVVDVTDAKALQDWISNLDCNLDLVIANAGISGGTADNNTENADQIQQIFRTNIEGTTNTVSPAVAKMQTVGKGQIAIISSLASFRGFAGAPAYCASKAAGRIYGEGLRSLLLKDNIKVSVICPGYVKTPMTDANDFKMPFMVDSHKAADIIKKGLAKNKARIAFPWQLYSIVWLISVLPAWFTDRLINKLPKKPGIVEEDTTFEKK